MGNVLDRLPAFGYPICAEGHIDMTNFVGGGNLGNVFRVHATEVRVSSLGHGVAEVMMLGPITQVSMAALRPSVLSACAGADALILRMDRGILAMEIGVVIPVRTYDGSSPPGAIVCRDDAGEFALWSEYAEQVSASGAMRAVFRASRLEWAMDWARHQALRSRTSRTKSTARLLQAQARNLVAASHGKGQAGESLDHPAVDQTTLPIR